VIKGFAEVLNNLLVQDRISHCSALPTPASPHASSMPVASRTSTSSPVPRAGGCASSSKKVKTGRGSLLYYHWRRWRIPEQVVEGLTASLPIEKVILFGSRARGTFRPDSDWDFLVVMPTALSRAERSPMVRRAARLKGIAMDFLVRTPDEMRDGFPLSKEILHEGQVVYDAQG